MFLSVQIGLGCGAAAGIAILAIWRSRRSGSTPEKRERRRSLALQATGRLGDALLTEVHEDTLYYTYRIRGVQYAASQDIRGLRDQLPGEPDGLIGVVVMKYALRNPANSILVCEEWSGLRKPAASANGNGIGHQAQDATWAQGSQG